MIKEDSELEEGRGVVVEGGRRRGRRSAQGFERGHGDMGEKRMQVRGKGNTA